MIIDAAEALRRLNAKIEDVCRYLMPWGRLQDDLWVTDAKEGHPAVRIHLEGPKIGTWVVDDPTRPTVIGRSLLELWAYVEKSTAQHAFREVVEYLGVAQGWDRTGGEPEEPKPRSNLASHWRALEEKSPAAAVAKRLGYMTKTLDAYGIGQDGKGNFLIFPCHAPDGTMVGFTYHECTGTGRMNTCGIPNGALFGTLAVPENATELAITADPLDAMALSEMGLPAVAIQTPTAKDPTKGGWLERSFDWMARFPVIYLAFAEKEADRLVEALTTRLGRERCRRVVWPAGKTSATMCFSDGFSSENLRAVLVEARHLDPAHLKRPSDYRRDIWKQFYPEDGKEPGWELPWAWPFRFRQQEITVWHGYTKHGKTIGLQFALVYFAWRYGVKVCVASMEIPAKITLQNVMRQTLGKAKPRDEAEFDRAITWLDEHFLIYDCLGTAQQNDMLAVFAYAARKYGVSHFVVDSLMKLDVDEEENESQKAFMNKLCAFATEHNAHVHLVAHDKKPDAKHPEERGYGGKYNVRGSAHVVDLAHNTVCIWRNKRKEIDLALAVEIRDAEERQTEINKLENQHDALWVVQAQRGGNGEEPIKQIFFNRESWQFGASRPVFAAEYMKKGAGNADESGNGIRNGEGGPQDAEPGGREEIPFDEGEGAEADVAVHEGGGSGDGEADTETPGGG